LPLTTLEGKIPVTKNQKVVVSTATFFYFGSMMKNFMLFLIVCLAVPGLSLAQKEFDIISLNEGLYVHRTTINSQEVSYNGLLIDAHSGYVLINPGNTLLESHKIGEWVKATDDKPILMVILTRADTSLFAGADYFIELGAIVSTTSSIARHCRKNMKFSPSGHLTSGNYTIGNLSFDIYAMNEENLVIWIEDYELVYGHQINEDMSSDRQNLKTKLASAAISIPFLGKISF